MVMKRVVYGELIMGCGLAAPNRLTENAEANVASAFRVFARHVCQLEGVSPLSNLMEVKD